MSQGAPNEGDQPGYAIDTSLGTEIARYDLMQISENTTTSNYMMAGLCNTDAAGQALGFGVAFTQWPESPQLYETALSQSRDIGSTYDAGKKRFLAIREEGIGYVKVAISSGGSNMTTVRSGIEMVPSDDVPGGVMPLAVSALTGTYNSTLIEGNALANRNVIGEARSNVIVPASGASWAGRPSLRGGTHVATLTALTNAITYGYVLMKFRN